MLKKLFFAITIVIALALIFWQGTEVNQDVDKRILESPRVLVGEHIFFVEVAVTEATRLQGLAGRAGLKDDEGMYFVFDTPDRYGFWMKGMFFSIDIIWIRGEEIIGFAENLPPDNSSSPQIYYPPAPVDRVLEVKAGMVQALGIKAGDMAQFLIP